MKALKNESTTYTEQIVSAIQSCYAQNSEPTNAQLTALYSLIGNRICQQGEKAFVAHLAKLLAEQLPQFGGFSMRNLRRMRNFYRTYENQPELMHKAQTLGWTQNAVILDCCEIDAQRFFYLNLADKKNLSKLALMRAIAAGTFEAATQENVAKEQDHCHTTMGITTPKKAVDTTDTLEMECEAFVTACEPLRQGSTPSFNREVHKTADYDDVFDNVANPTNMTSLTCAKPLISVFQKATKRMLKMSVYLYRVERWWRILERPPRGQPPPPVELAQIYMGRKRPSHVISLLTQPVSG